MSDRACHRCGRKLGKVKYAVHIIHRYPDGDVDLGWFDVGPECKDRYCSGKDVDVEVQKA